MKNNTNPNDETVENKIKRLEGYVNKLIQRNELLLNKVVNYKRKIIELEGTDKSNDAVNYEGSGKNKEHIRSLVTAVEECLDITQNMIDNREKH